MRRILIALLLITIVLITSCSGKTVTPNGGEASPTPPAQETPSQPPDETETPPVSPSPETEDEEPQSEVYTDTITIEGMPETVSYTRVKGSYRYTMPMDVDRFEFIKTDEKDYFICALNEHVWASVEYKETATIEEMKKKLPEFPEEAIVSENDVTIAESGYAARHIHAVYGASYDSTVMDFYIIGDGAGGFYLITHCYFLEGAEGWGARLYYMMEDFVIEKA